MNKKTVFITGIAGGIGLALGEYFIKQGWIVGGCDLQSDFAESRGIHYYPCDVCNTSQVERVLQEFRSRVDAPLDLFINNAAVLYMGSLFLLEDTEIRKMTEVNYLSVVKLIKVIPRYLIKGGTVMTILSGSCLNGMPDNTVYSSLKRALLNFIEGLAMECKAYGVDLKFKNIIPTNVDTPMIHPEKGYLSRVVVDPNFPAIPPEKIALTAAKALKSRKMNHYAGGNLYVLSILSRLLPGVFRTILKSCAMGTLVAEGGNFKPVDREDILKAAYEEKVLVNH